MRKLNRKTCKEPQTNKSVNKKQNSGLTQFMQFVKK